VKGLQVALLTVIAAALLWGGASVRSFPRRLFSAVAQPGSSQGADTHYARVVNTGMWKLEEGRDHLSSGNYTLAAAEFSAVIQEHPGTDTAQGAALLLAKVRLAQGDRVRARDVLRQFAPAVNADSFLSQH
jgi:outer membrane protein assembly factor BamD (BamD/ComL family)